MIKADFLFSEVIHYNLLYIFIKNERKIYIILICVCILCRCRGLMLLETYTALSGNELKNILPQFLTIVKEVTNNPDYSMFNLSLREEWNSTNKYCHNMHGTSYLNIIKSLSLFIFFTSYTYFLYTYTYFFYGFTSDIVIDSYIQV